MWIKSNYLYTEKVDMSKYATKNYVDNNFTTLSEVKQYTLETYAKKSEGAKYTVDNNTLKISVNQ